MTDRDALTPVGATFTPTTSRRSRAACTFCRWRKVRCDGAPGRSCSNCAFERVDCTIPQRKPRKKPYTKRMHTRTFSDDIDAPRPASNARESSVHEATTESTTSRHSREPVDHTTTLQSPCDGEVETTHAHTDSPGSATRTQDREACDFDWHAAAAECLPSPPSTAGLTGSQRGLQSDNQERNHPPNRALPPFIKPIPKHLQPEDVEYLHVKGAFLIPEPELCHQLLQGYIDYIHPWLPLVDVHAFVASIEDPSRHGPVSLLLFTAVMFAGACWGDIRSVRRAGYWTRHDMRTALHRRAAVSTAEVPRRFWAILT